MALKKTALFGTFYGHEMPYPVERAARALDVGLYRNEDVQTLRAWAVTVYMSGKGDEVAHMMRGWINDRLKKNPGGMLVA